MLSLNLATLFWKRFREPVISVFIFAHISALVLWVCPPFPLYWSILPCFSPYISYLGFWNQWKMFSHPKAWNAYLTATISFSDGTTKVWQFPRTDQMDYLTRAWKERYRKWGNEYINDDKYDFARADAARFIARQFSNDKNKPIEVQFVRHWSFIQPPPGIGKPQPTDEGAYTFFRYRVKPEDFE